MNFFQIVNFETLTNGFRVELLDFIALASIIAGVFVVISKNPIVSVLFLIGLFCSISGYLFALGIIYIGLAYLLVYVGAVSILFLFILMLINVRISELLFDTSNSRPLAIIISVLFFSIVGFSIPNYRNGLLVLGKIWDGILAETNHITSIGNIMYTHLSIWLIIASIILLLAMVGAIVITIKQKVSGLDKRSSIFSNTPNTVKAMSVPVGVLGPVSEMDSEIDSEYVSLEDILGISSCDDTSLMESCECFSKSLCEWVDSQDNSSVDFQYNSSVEDLVSIYGDHSSHLCCTQWLSLVDMAHMSEAINVFGVVGCC